jgi:tetratricopeptide (TPR) repeat protein
MNTARWIAETAMAALLITATARPVHAADALQGAAAILKKVAEKSGQAAEPDAKPPSETARLRADLTNFTARVATLPPAEAARGWLALADRFDKLPVDFTGMNRERPLEPMELLHALPPPAAWAELARAIEARPKPEKLADISEVGLRLLAHTLTGNRAAQTSDLALLEPLLAKAPRRQAMQVGQQLVQVHEAFQRHSDDTNAILAAFERQIANAEGDDRHGGSYLNVPDLVTLAGDVKAEQLIKRALLSKARQIRFTGEATTKLARRIALQNVNELKRPPWSLADSTDAMELYEALEKKFAKAATNAAPAVRIPGLPSAFADVGGFNDEFGHERQQARGYYLLGLIVAGRSADAVKLAKEMAGDETSAGLPHEAVKALERAGHTRALDDFLHGLLAQNPELPLWADYVRIAAHAGTTERMLKLAREAAAQPALAGRKGLAVRENLYAALLAADQVEEGVRELRALLQAQGEKPAGAARRNPYSFSMNLGGEAQHALTLARLGQLLDRKDWLDEGIAAAKKALANQADDEAMGFGLGDDSLTGLVDLLQDTGRAAEAEQLLADRLIKEAAKPADDGMNFYRSSLGGEANGTLAVLVRVYHRAGRHADVLALLESAPQWNIRDLAEVVAHTSGESKQMLQMLGGSGEGDSLGFHAASALIAAGRMDEARKLVDAMLDFQGGYDPAFELLVQLAGQDALSRLDELFARDQFEERPLIWKALLLHRAGKHEEAEKVARQAIGIDPSDGEQGPGRRMRVYAVLADIRDARGDKTQAEFFRGVVRAIRQSETADRFHGAGLLSRAVKMYQDSLKHFSDAYCIQSRLAVQMAELGQHELALQHYQKAFELMPDSFGRVESHCFGCERTFDSPQAQTLAERVFNDLAAKNPAKPQVHYLLGYLRDEQERHAQALTHYRRAVELDPDYLNAWVKIGKLAGAMRLSAADRDRVVLNVLRLDPLSRHGHANLNMATDLRALWNALEAARKLQPVAPKALLALPASQRALEAAEQERKKQHRDGYSEMYFGMDFGRSSGALPPAVALAQHELLRVSSDLLSARRFGMLEE